MSGGERGELRRMKTREVARLIRFKRSATPKFWIDQPDSFLVLTNRRLFVECEVIGEGLLG